MYYKSIIRAYYYYGVELIQEQLDTIRDDTDPAWEQWKMPTLCAEYMTYEDIIEYMPHYSLDGERDLIAYHDRKSGKNYKVKPGKFLAKIVGDQQVIKDFANKFLGHVGNTIFNVLHETRDIIQVYENIGKYIYDEYGDAEENPAGSCMTYYRDRWDELEDNHPAVVYGSLLKGQVADTSLAVLYDDDGEVLARTILNNKSKGYVRIYGNEKYRSRLGDELYSIGYKRRVDLDNCILNGVQLEDGSYVIPYIDGDACYVKPWDDGIMCSYEPDAGGWFDTHESNHYNVCRVDFTKLVR